MTLTTVASDAPVRLGLDVGGTKTDAVAVDRSGAILARVRIPTRWGAEGVVEGICDATSRLSEELGMPRAAIASIGVGIPGQIDRATGTVRHAVNLGVDELTLADALEPLLGLRVGVENDVKAAALGAARLRGVGADGSMALLNLGTGVAAGIVAGGDLWRGARGIAGEVGHISIDPVGPVCKCGQRGCIEVFVGGAAIAAAWGGSEPLAVAAVFDAADAGDPRAIALRSGLADGVAAAVRVLVLTTDVDTVVLGGGLSNLGNRLLEVVHDSLITGGARSPFIHSLALEQRVEVLAVGSPAAALGAALVGLQEVPHG